ncbi:restriction endonuclease subunit S [Photobacterium sp. GB-72]|uniref:restriction endonuclease subunit S n=1 Tax=Photobacterium sp. GB-72 TaxID=2022105 RepID=UPI000D166074|nr:restriction endonuclease subunit S [Photobacterium sp. GB-72]PSV32987.1 restriction endonuclease subunit S [Photobacterium sp. GB-72]
MSWPLVKLGDICETTQGVQITKANTQSELYEGGFRYLYIADFISDKKLSFVDDAFEKKKVTTDDLVMANTGSPGRVFKGKEGILSNNLFKITFDRGVVDRDYLYLLLSSEAFQSVLQQQMKGGIQKHLGHQTISRQEIPLPPLEEQKRIAAILDKADAIRQKRKQAIELADEFLRSVFLDMFGDPVTNPKGWEERKLITGLYKVQSGWSAKGESFPCASNELGVLKVSAVTSGYFKEYENKFVSREIVPEGKSLLFPRKGDLLFSRANTRELVAATCIVTRDYDNVFLPDKLWKVETNEDLIPEFLHMLIQQPRFKERLTSQATGSSGSMLNISKAKFEQTMSIFPSIEKQMKFKEIYWKVMRSLTSLEISDAKADDFFGSLSQKAFSGQL